MSILVQRHDFDIGAEIAQLRAGRTDIGAVCSFVGTVRDVPLLLEHYPGMTERMLETLEHQARQRFDLRSVRIVHRYGDLAPGDNIVLVLTLSRHRQPAFDGANFIMDSLKTQAPFWKLEKGTWIDQRPADVKAVKNWQQNKSLRP